MSAVTLCTKATPALNAVQSQLTADMTPTAVVGNGLKQSEQFSQCMLHSHIMIWPHPDMRTAITGKETQKIKRLPMQCMYSPKSYSTGHNGCPISLLPRVWHASGSAHTTFYTLFLQHLYICEPPGTPILSGGFTSRVMKHNHKPPKGRRCVQRCRKARSWHLSACSILDIPVPSRPVCYKQLSSVSKSILLYSAVVCHCLCGLFHLLFYLASVSAAELPRD